MNPDLIRQQIANLRLAHPDLDEDEEAWLLSLESETDFRSFMREVESARQMAESNAIAINGRIAELKVRLARYGRREELCRKLMFNTLQSAGTRKLELPEATLSIRNGQQKVIITDEAAVPDQFCRFKREPNKETIKAQL